MVQTISQASMPIELAGRALRLGTRGSQLALVQAALVVTRLREMYPSLIVDAHIVSTQGDRDKQTPLAIIGGQGVFVKDVHAGILTGAIDGAVHSAKDLTSTPPDGIALGALLDRGDARDVLISAHPGGLADLPPGARVGTSSRRRIVQLRRVRPDIVAVELRGNIDTRMSKVTEGGQLDGAIIAAAGVERLGHQARIAEYLSVDDFVPAPAQAALGVDCRAEDAAMIELLGSISEPRVCATVGAERAFLRTIGGGCRSPLAAHATLDGDRLTLRTMAASEDLERVAMLIETTDILDGERLAADMAERLRADVLS